MKYSTRLNKLENEVPARRVSDKELIKNLSEEDMLKMYEDAGKSSPKIDRMGSEEIRNVYFDAVRA